MVEETVYEQAQNLPDIVKVEFSARTSRRQAVSMPRACTEWSINFLANASEAMVGRGEDPSTFTTPRRASSSPPAEERGELKSSARDNGPGIAEENWQRSGNRSSPPRHSASAWDSAGIEKALTEHGGGLHIQSKLDVGTTMTAWFPIADRQAGRQRDHEQGTEILVVDDDKDNANSLAEIFELEGHRVVRAHSGKDAITASAGETSTWRSWTSRCPRKTEWRASWRFASSSRRPASI